MNLPTIANSETQGSEGAGSAVQDKLRSFAEAVVQLQSRIASGAIGKESASKMLQFMAQQLDISPQDAQKITQNAGAVKKAIGPLVKPGKEGQSRIGQFFDSVKGVMKTGIETGADAVAKGASSVASSAVEGIETGANAVGSVASSAVEGLDKVGTFAQEHPTAVNLMGAAASGLSRNNATRQGVYEAIKGGNERRLAAQLEREKMSAAENAAKIKAEADAKNKNKDPFTMYAQGRPGDDPRKVAEDWKKISASNDSMWETYWQAEKALGTPPQQAVKDFKLLSQDGEAGKVAMANYQKGKVQDLINQFKRRTDTMGAIETISDSGKINRLNNWLQQRSIIEGNPFLTDNNLDEAEVAIMSDLGLDRAMIDNIRVLRMSGATNQQIMDILKMELGGAQ